MQARGAVLPKLDARRRDAEAGPELRPRHLADAEFESEFGDPALEREQAFKRRRLARCPGAELAVAVAGGKIIVRLLRRDLAHRPFDAHLAADRHPVEAERRMGIGAHLAALAAFEIGVKGEARRIIILEQHHAEARPARLIRRRQRHRAGLAQSALLGARIPFAEQVERVSVLGNRHGGIYPFTTIICYRNGGTSRRWV